MSAAMRQPGGAIARQPQALPQPNDVGVERHDQPRRRDARPDAEVDRIAPHHPAQEEIQRLHALPPTAAGRSSTTPGRCRQSAVARSADRAPARALENESRAGPTSGAIRSSPAAKNASIDPARSSICRSTQSSATMSRPTRPAMDERRERRGLHAADRTSGRTPRAMAPSVRTPHDRRSSRWRRARKPVPRRRIRPPRDPGPRRELTDQVRPGHGHRRRRR